MVSMMVRDREVVTIGIDPKSRCKSRLNISEDQIFIMLSPCMRTESHCAQHIHNSCSLIRLI